MQNTSSIKREETSAVHDAMGTHLLLTLRGCTADLLNDKGELELLARSAASATGATVLQTFTHAFEPQGVTALVVLAESHASLHTYPESQVVFWDCFTCGSKCRPELSADVLISALKPASVEEQMIRRG